MYIKIQQLAMWLTNERLKYDSTSETEWDKAQILSNVF